MDYNLQRLHMLQYNHRQLPFKMALTVDYAGSRGANEGFPSSAQLKEIDHDR